MLAAANGKSEMIEFLIKESKFTIIFKFEIFFIVKVDPFQKN